MDNFTFRLATENDAARIWEMLQQAKAQMYREGKQQWDESYPLPQNVADDIRNGYAHVLCRQDVVVAYGAVTFDGEPAYDTIEGKWLSEKPYVVVHRLAVADEVKRQGVATRFMMEVERLAVARGVYSFKVDTNFDNFYMQHIMKNLDFKLCGTVRYPRGERMGYEKQLKNSALRTK